jgi:hypothetical protein
MPGRTNAIGITQLSIVPTISPGYAIKGFARLNNVPAPVDRRIVYVIPVKCLRIAARQKQKGYKEKKDERACRRLFQQAITLKGTGREPRGHR